jgi:hypothetical protein
MPDKQCTCVLMTLGGLVNYLHLYLQINFNWPNVTLNRKATSVAGQDNMIVQGYQIIKFGTH